jgi:DNA-binding LacI/PurR family transcriptional regulator
MVIGDSTVEWGRAAAAQALAKWPDTDALVCANDLIGVGALLFFEEAGVPVPGQVAVTGFDDTVIAAITRPALTSVAQPVAEVARLAVEFAQSGRPGEDARQILIPPRTVLRASSG